MLNKRDLLPDEDAKVVATQIVKKLRFTGPVFLISGATGEGTGPLCQSIMTLLEDVAAGRESQITGGYELPKAVAAKRAVAKKKSSSQKKPAPRRKAAPKNKVAPKKKAALKKKAGLKKKVAPRKKAARPK